MSKITRRVMRLNDDADKPSLFRRALTFAVFFSNIYNLLTFSSVAADRLLPQFSCLC